MATACCSCFILPKSKTTQRTVGTRETTDRGPLGPVTLSLRVRDAHLVVEAMRPRACVDRVTSIVEETVEQEATIEVLDPGWPSDAVALWLVFAPVTGLISGVGTALVLATDDEPTTRRFVPLSSAHRSCPVPAAYTRVQLTMPSGATLEQVTDAAGRARFALPDTEPPSGSVLARADSVRAKPFRYGAETKPLTRDEVRAALRSARAGVERCGRRAGLSGTHALTMVIEGGTAYLLPDAELPATFVSCADEVLYPVEIRPAGRVRVTYPLALPAAAGRDARPSRPAIPKPELIRLRKQCAVPIARWRTGRTRSVPEACRRLLPDRPTQ